MKQPEGVNENFGYEVVFTNQALNAAKDLKDAHQRIQKLRSQIAHEENTLLVEERHINDLRRSVHFVRGKVDKALWENGNKEEGDLVQTARTQWEKEFGGLTWRLSVGKPGSFGPINEVDPKWVVIFAAEEKEGNND